MTQFLDDDIVDVRIDGEAKPFQLYWGEPVEPLEPAIGATRKVRFTRYGRSVEGRIKAEARFRDTPILRLSMVDVQQGDGLVLETPGGKRVLIDGGDNQLFARHVATRFPGSSPTEPIVFDAILVTHGDADHFDGLNEILRSETHSEARKRLFATTRRVLHNGLVKRGSAVPEKDRLGPTLKADGRTWCVDLHDDLLSVPDAEMNAPFLHWKRTLEKWDTRLAAIQPGASIEMTRVDQHATDAFAFLAEPDLDIEILGPITRQVAGRTALLGLSSPPNDANIELGDPDRRLSSSMSVSHTINGHSIAFRLRYGNVRVLFTGDMNQEAMQMMREALPNASLRAEIFKTPHHGSHDFDLAFLHEVGPVVSMISSGDESATKEHIHPRATLMAALGRASRSSPAVIFCTELAAFFKARGNATLDRPPGDTFFAFERTNFGIVHVRTDGERVLAFTHSGKAGVNEAYRFTVSATGAVTFAPRVSKMSAPKAA
jgi:beta-lactamase superfamily II metal-dependent hydrolase